MTDLETVARIRVRGGAHAERLVCHPRLPLVAGLDSERPAVHVWDCAAGELRKLGTTGAGSAVYGDAVGWERRQRVPAAAWHPDQPLLVVAAEGTVRRWTPAGFSRMGGMPRAAAYRSLAFSPDGGTLWASPSATWGCSDAISLASGAISTGRHWDTGVAAHPSGRLVATLNSDQGGTLVLFAPAGQQDPGAAMRVLRRALVLDVDGYETPVFSADGSHFAIRGNAYGNMLQVFEFPSLARVLATVLGEPAPPYPYPQEWLGQMRAWSQHNIAFGSQPGVLWVGTPAGTLVEVNFDSPDAAEHDVLAGTPVTALAATAAGDLVVAGGQGELALLSVPVGAAPTRTPDGDTMRAAVAAFLDGTSEVPDDDDDHRGLWKHLVMTDGTRTWGPGDLADVTTATTADPTWLQLQAAINNALGSRTQQD